MNGKNKLFRNGIFLLTILAAVILLATPSTVMAQNGDNDDQIVLGGRFRLQSDETIDGNLIVIGGTAILEAGSRVRGDVLMTGGTLESAGTIEGNLTALGGSVELMDEAVVQGNVILNSAGFTRSPDAEVLGDIRTNVGLDALDLDGLPSINVPEPDYTNPFRAWVDFLIGAIWWVLRVAAIAGLGALVVLIAPKPTERVAKSIAIQPVIASAFGLLTAIVAPALLVLLTITIILIPVSVIGVLILAVAGLFGWVALGYLIGQRLEKALNQTWAPAIRGGVGTLLLTIVTGMFGIIPCIGWIISAIAAILGLGGVLISRFGSQVYGESNSVYTGSMSANASTAAPATKVIDDGETPSHSQSHNDEI